MDQGGIASVIGTDSFETEVHATQTVAHKKGTSAKAPDVRIKAFRYNMKLYVYHNINRSFKAWLPP